MAANISYKGPIARYVKIGIAHASGMPRTFSQPPQVSNPDMHRGTCVMGVPWCMPESLSSGFLWSRWRGKRFWHSQRMSNPKFYISGKRPVKYRNKFGAPHQNSNTMNSGRIPNPNKYSGIIHTDYINHEIPIYKRRCRWNLEMDKLFQTTYHWACDYLSMLALRLIHFSKWSPWR